MRLKKVLTISPQYPKEAAVEEGDSVIVEVTPERVASWGID
jgi:hypothetical protein